MLTNVRYNEDEYGFPCLLVLGCFDGIHIGHAELLKKAKLQAKINGLDLGVMVFSNGKGGKQIYTFEERLRLLEQYNVKFVLSVEYDDEFKKTAPLDFLQNLEEKLNLKAYMSGKDFRFGNGAKGKSSTLKSYAEDDENGVWYMPVKEITSADGEKVSATKIKQLLESGEIPAANGLLGRSFSLCAPAAYAENADGLLKLGLTYPAEKVDIKHGAYSIKCVLGDKEYEGVATYGENGNVLEVCLNGADGVADGENVTVEFLEYSGGAQNNGADSGLTAEEAVEELAVTEDAPSENVEEVQEVTTEPVETETVQEEQPYEDDGFDDELDEEYVEVEENGEEAPEAQPVEEENTEENVSETQVEVAQEEQSTEVEPAPEQIIENEGEQISETEGEQVSEDAPETDGETQVETATAEEIPEPEPENNGNENGEENVD